MNLFFTIHIEEEYVIDSPFRHVGYWLPSYFSYGMDGSIDSFISCFALVNNKRFLSEKELLSQTIIDSIQIEEDAAKDYFRLYTDSNSISKFLNKTYNRKENFKQEAMFRLKDTPFSSIQIYLVFQNKKTLEFDTIKSNIMTLNQ